jgi:putative transposase
MTDRLAAWPVARPRNWVRIVNAPQDEKELAALRVSGQRGRPYGDAAWMLKTARRLEIESSLRPVGRPRRRAERDSKENGL